MIDKKITFQQEHSRHIGILMDEAPIQEQVAEWQREDHAKLLMLCEHYGIQVNPFMFYELSLALARELFPAPKQPGRKLKWTMLNKGALVVEVERLVKRNDPSHGVEWACKKLARREPWASFIQEKENSSFGANPAEALRKIYFAFRNDKWANVSRKAFKMYEHEEAIADWDDCVVDFVRNPHYK